MEYLDKEGLIKVWDKTTKQLDRKANKVHKHNTEDIDGLQDYATEEYVNEQTNILKLYIDQRIKEILLNGEW